MITELTVIEESVRGTPPCDCILALDGTTCGKPSAFRLLTVCDGCHTPRTGFACAPCWEYIRPYASLQLFTCAWCGAPRTLRVI